MFKNPKLDEHMQPDKLDLGSEDGMTHGLKTNSFLEVGNKKEIDNNKLLFPIHINFNKYTNHEELYQGIKNWWTNTKNRAPKTIKTRINALRFCQKHPIYPVDWFHFDQEPEQILNLLLYMINIEYKQKAITTGNHNYGLNQIHNIWKTVKTMAEAKGVDITWWGWTPPSRPENKVKIIPRPKTVNHLIHYNYTNDKITNSLIKTILTLGFNSGLRPEELIILQVKNIDFDTCSIILTEQKKRYRNRQIRIEPPVMYSPKQNSMYNWIYIWRPRITTETDGYLFIQNNKKPFITEDSLRTFLAKRIKHIWKPFSPKKVRDWNAIARLIRTKEKTGQWDIRTVTKALGHKHQSTTEGYVEFAELYYQNDKYDWLRSVLKHQICLMQEHRSSQKHEKPLNTQKTLGLKNITTVGQLCSRRGYKNITPVEKIVKNTFPTFLFKTFFFSLQTQNMGVAG